MKHGRIFFLTNKQKKIMDKKERKLSSFEHDNIYMSARYCITIGKGNPEWGSPTEEELPKSL